MLSLILTMVLQMKEWRLRKVKLVAKTPKLVSSKPSLFCPPVQPFSVVWPDSTIAGHGF